MSRRGLALFAAMCVLWGIPYLFIKVAVDEMAPATLVLWRTGVAAALLVPVAAARGQLRPLLPRWRPLLLFSVAELALPWYFLSAAERHLTSSLTGLLIAAVPLVALVLAWAAGEGDRPGLRRVAGLVAGLLGVAALVGLDVGHTGGVTPLLQVGVVVVGYAIGPLVLSRRLSDLPSLAVIASSLLVTALVYVPFGVASWPRRAPSTAALVAVLVLALVCTALAFLLFFALIAEIGPTRATVITYVNPAVAVTLGIAFLDEPLTVGIVVGFVLVLAGSVLATYRAPAPAASEPAAMTPAGPPA